jgi:hypothetical protein
MYDYKEVIKEDIREFLEENYLEEVTVEDFDNLYDELWIHDSVTGNASGSYFCNRYKAKECVIDNIDLLNEAFYEFGCDSTEVGERFLNEEWEYFDVTIRCYLLGSCLAEVLEEAEEE